MLQHDRLEGVNDGQYFCAIANLRVLKGFRIASAGGHLMVLQYFLPPDEQKYGKEIVSSPKDLLRFVTQAGFEIRHEVYIGARPPNDLLLWASEPTA